MAGLMRWGTNYGGIIGNTSSIDDLASNTWYYCRSRSDFNEGYMYNITPSKSDAVKGGAIQILFELGGIVRTRIKSWSTGVWTEWKQVQFAS